MVNNHICAGWEEEYCSNLLGMVVDLWDIIQGFSQATAWMEQYKATQKDIQKANGLIHYVYYII